MADPIGLDNVDSQQIAACQLADAMNVEYLTALAVVQARDGSAGTNMRHNA